jgi:hypothetical protein
MQHGEYGYRGWRCQGKMLHCTMIYEGLEKAFEIKV